MKRSIPRRESLRVEFKSDRRRLPDRELVLAAVCLANTEGGTLYVGVEDDGRVTGLHPAHRDLTGLAAMIANRTVPPLSVRISALDEEGQRIAGIEVPRSLRLVATSEGTIQRRRLLADGTPQCVPFLPHEFASRESHLGLTDYSALPVAGTTTEDFDLLERQRLRRAIETHHGDRALLGLEDSELDGALGLIRREGGRPVPTVAGLLLIGREDALRWHLPTHEVAFQVLDETDVRVNDFYRYPLVRVFERVEEQFTARLTEDEIEVGLFRVPVPRVDRRAFRESLVNALTHRDYTRLGAIHVRWQREEMVVSSPGGFVEGVSLDNLLVVEPQPRNPLLADAFKRIGLAERTGRGVDLIYQGLLRYGRPAPSYGRSSPTTVVVELSCAEADLAFLRLILGEEERSKVPMPFQSLLVLSKLREERRVDASEVASALQRDAGVARAALERLVEGGLVEAHGVKRGRTYTLSAAVYRREGKAGNYVRQAGFDRLQQEQMIRAFVREHGSIRRQDVIELCKLNPHQASRLLQRLVEQKALVRKGKHRGTFYEGGAKL